MVKECKCGKNTHLGLKVPINLTFDDRQMIFEIVLEFFRSNIKQASKAILLEKPTSMIKQLPFYILFLGLFFSCSDKAPTIIDLVPEDMVVSEPIDESTLSLHDGFTDRKFNTQIKAILPAEKSILLTKSATGVDQLVKFDFTAQFDHWKAATWYPERLGVRNHHYRHEDVILFRQGHHDFAIDLRDGTLRYDEEREGCPDSKLVGIGEHFFTWGVVVDEATQQEKEVVFMGDIREPDMPQKLLSPPYNAEGRDGSLGRIMGLHAFANEQGEELLAIRFFDFDPEAPLLQDFFAVYNVTQRSWQVPQVPLEFHDTGANSVVANGFIYYGSQSYISCVDTKTGAMQWVAEGYAIASPSMLAFADGAIFMSNQGMLQRRDANTGDLIWETPLGNIQRFIVVHDKVFSIAADFSITSMETGEILHSFSSPYLEDESNFYFGKTKDLLGYYDEELKRTYIFFNIEDNLITYELEEE